MFYRHFLMWGNDSEGFAWQDGGISVPDASERLNVTSTWVPNSTSGDDIESTESVAGCNMQVQKQPETQKAPTE
jgi:hypothetical protein